MVAMKSAAVGSAVGRTTVLLTLLLSTLAEPAVSTVLLPLLLSTLAEPAVSTVLLPLLLSDLAVPAECEMGAHA